MRKLKSSISNHPGICLVKNSFIFLIIFTLLLSIEAFSDDLADTGYYVIVRAEEAYRLSEEVGEPEGNEIKGIKLRQEPRSDSPLSLNIVIPDGTLLHITSEEEDSEGNHWGFTEYAGLKAGYVDLRRVSMAEVVTPEEYLKKHSVIGQSPDFDKYFQRLDQDGNPISREEYESRKESETETEEESSEEEEGDQEETVKELETDESGNPILETDADGNELIELNKDGFPVFRQDINGKWIIPKDNEGYPYFETDANGNPSVEYDDNGNIVIPSEGIRPKKSYGGIILGFILGVGAVVIMEGMAALMVVFIGRRKRKKNLEEEQDS